MTKKIRSNIISIQQTKYQLSIKELPRNIGKISSFGIYYFYILLLNHDEPIKSIDLKTTKENIHQIIFLINSDEGLSANMINICYDEFNNIINKLKNFDPKIKSIV